MKFQQRRGVTQRACLVLLSFGLAPLWSGCSAAGLANADFNIHDPVPTVTGVSPNTGPAAGGTVVTITGTGFTNDGAQLQVSLKNTGGALQVKVISSTKVTFITTPGMGTADVQVSTDGGSSSITPADRFVYK